MVSNGEIRKKYLGGPLKKYQNSWQNKYKNKLLMKILSYNKHKIYPEK
jgi:hypothetical protein